jgi:uncharacterized protein with GYD domain
MVPGESTSESRRRNLDGKEDWWMPTYIVRFRYTAKALENIADTPKRLDAFKEFFRSQGIEVKGFYLTMGQYDGEFILEASDDELLARTILAWTARGTITTETARAFTEDEFRRIGEALS